MNRRLAIQCAPTALVMASLVGLTVFAEVTDMASAVKAPLYAIVAATGIAAAVGPPTKQNTERKRRIVDQSMTALAASGSAYWWLVSVNAGTVIEAVAAVWLCIAVFVIVHYAEKSVQSLDNG